MVLVDANFLEDVRVQLLAFIDAGGIALPNASGRTVSEVAGTYFALKRRLLTPTRRTVRWSQTLLQQALSPTQRSVIAEITRRSEAGESLVRFLSTQVTKRPDTNDALLNEWGFFHFHLGSISPRRDGYVQRSGDLLFAFATPNELLLTLLGDHQSFVDNDLLQIVHDNWPEAIAEDRANGWSRSDDDERHSPEFRRFARARGFSIMSEVNDGTLYTPPGGGYMMNGQSARARMAANRLLNRAREVEEDIRQRADVFAGHVQRHAGRQLRELHLNLILGKSLTVLETQSRVVLPVAPG